MSNLNFGIFRLVNSCARYFAARENRRPFCGPYLRRDDTPSTFRIVKILNWHPLAIEQAAAIIEKVIIPMPNYAAKNNANYSRLMSYRPLRGIWVSERNRSVFNAFEILSESLERDSPDAAALLKVGSIHDSSEIHAD
jgi:hypothetical protein